MLLPSCKENKKVMANIISKEYGPKDIVNDSLSVEIDLSKFPTYVELHDRMRELSCKDSTPKIIFKSDTILKTVYFPEACMEGYACILIKEKNVLQITQDSIFKASYELPIDSLIYFMEKDYLNNGEDPTLSDSPDKLSINILYTENQKTVNLIKLLDKITKSFDSVNVDAPFYISLFQKLTIKPPPPPPID